MTPYQAPYRDLQFVVHELLAATSDGDDAILSRETVDQVLEAAGRFATEVLAPLNSIGDREGCSVSAAGKVLTPSGFKSAYDQFVAGGWTSLGCDPEHGGQGLPLLVNAAINEVFIGANMALASYPGMSNAAYACLAANGSPEQKALYLPRLASGQWAGTMCLTEPHCGTDLGLLTTRAVPRADGSHEVTGNKIFISGGDQDLTENIVHLVLARLPDAPPGVRGISLFVVPKVCHTASGELRDRNAVSCSSVEHKMGIRGNSTCSMNFEGATGWIVGRPNNGLAAMFVMMNRARLGVGTSAIGLAEAAYQKALAYAKDRNQGRHSASRGGDAEPIIGHPDVQRMLLTQRAYVEGMRAFALWVAQLSDIQANPPSPEEAATAANFSALLTPVVKAFCSDTACECAALAMQVYGGHGYIWENGVEQHLRDARIIPLYEGTNGVQAMDLLGRKVVADGGKVLTTFLGEIRQFLRSEDGARLAPEMTAPLHEALELTESATHGLLSRVGTDLDLVGWVAAAYLRLIGHLCLAWIWARSAAIATQRLHVGDPIYNAKLITAKFYFSRLLPEVKSLAAEIASQEIHHGGMT